MLMSLAAGLLTIVVILYLVLAVGLYLVGLDIERYYGFEIATSLTVIGLVYSLVGVIRTSRPNSLVIEQIQADIDTGRAIVTDYDVIDVKAFQEPEHGGLIYFLRTSDDMVYVAFDYESQNLGVQGRDPASSGFTPRTRLRIIKGAKSGMTIDSGFSGEPMHVADAIPLTTHPNFWPEPEEFVDVPWSQLDVKFGG